MNNILSELDNYKSDNDPISYCSNYKQKYSKQNPPKRNNFTKTVKKQVFQKQLDEDGYLRCRSTNFILGHSFLKNYDHIDDDSSNNSLKNAQLITSEMNTLKEFDTKQYQEIMQNSENYALQKVYDMFYNNDKISEKVNYIIMNAYYECKKILSHQYSSSS